MFVCYFLVIVRHATHQREANPKVTLTIDVGRQREKQHTTAQQPGTEGKPKLADSGGKVNCCTLCTDPACVSPFANPG